MSECPGQSPVQNTNKQKKVAGAILILIWKDGSDKPTGCAFITHMKRKKGSRKTEKKSYK